jgi:sarcosine oxidase subunit beta
MPELGPSVLAATWCALDGFANSLLVVPAYLAAAKRGGATVRTHSPVRALDRTRDSWSVVTDSGSFSVGSVINAAGPWMSQISALAGQQLQLTPVAIQMHETVRAPRMVDYLVQHIGHGLSVKQVASGNVLVGGGWPAGALNLEGVSSISEDSVRGNMADAVRVLPAVGELALSRVWAGPLAATPDEMPVIGELRDAPGLFVEGGTYAFTFSPLWAQITADLVLGATPSYDVTAFAPERLRIPTEAVG